MKFLPHGLIYCTRLAKEYKYERLEVVPIDRYKSNQLNMDNDKPNRNDLLEADRVIEERSVGEALSNEDMIIETGSVIESTSNETLVEESEVRYKLFQYETKRPKW